MNMQQPSENDNERIKNHENKNSILDYIVLIFVFCVVILIIMSLKQPPSFRDYEIKIMNDKGIYKIKLRDYNCQSINSNIYNYYYKNKKYPKDMSEIATFNSKEQLSDPLTNKSDWEVCENKNKDMWYRTTKEPYDPILPFWNSNEHDGICKIRPRKVTEEIEIRKRWNSYLENVEILSN